MLMSPPLGRSTLREEPAFFFLFSFAVLEPHAWEAGALPLESLPQHDFFFLTAGATLYVGDREEGF
jgi:hypothetical protein